MRDWPSSPWKNLVLVFVSLWSAGSVVCRGWAGAREASQIEHLGDFEFSPSNDYRCPRLLGSSRQTPIAVTGLVSVIVSQTLVESVFWTSQVTFWRILDAPVSPVPFVGSDIFVFDSSMNVECVPTIFQGLMQARLNNRQGQRHFQMPIRKDQSSTCGLFLIGGIFREFIIVLHFWTLHSHFCWAPTSIENQHRKYKLLAFLDSICGKGFNPNPRSVAFIPVDQTGLQKGYSSVNEDQSGSDLAPKKNLVIMGAALCLAGFILLFKVLDKVYLDSRLNVNVAVCGFFAAFGVFLLGGWVVFVVFRLV